MNVYETYCQSDAHQLAAFIKQKEISVVEALDCAQRRIQEVNPKLNALVYDCHHLAQDCLKSLKGDEPFYGVPFMVKDLGLSLKNIPHHNGSFFFSNILPPLHSDFITSLLKLGFLPVGTTTAPELGLSFATESKLQGQTSNPYDISCTPGGSSGGSAAMVAARAVPMATGSDGGGSIRTPAACCGLFGFKPSAAHTSYGPWVGESWSGLACPHVLTRSVRDSLAIYRHTVVPNWPWQLQETQQLLAKPIPKAHIVLIEGAFWDVPVAQDCQAAVDKVIAIFKDMGFIVEKKKIQLDLQQIGEQAMILIAANTWAVIEERQKMLGRRAKKQELEEVTWAFLRKGKQYSAAQLIQAKNKLYQQLLPLYQLLEEVDCVLTPALAQLPIPLGSLYAEADFAEYLRRNQLFSPFTGLFNQAGTPAFTLPVMFNGHFPISVQLAAARGKDLFLFRLAQQLQDYLDKQQKSSIPAPILLK